MDDFEPLCYFNKDKAVNVLAVANELLIFLIISFMSVFVPLAYSLAGSSTDMITMFKYFVIGVPIVILPIVTFLIAKYREYKYLYDKSLIKSIVRNILQSPETPSEVDYNFICTKIVYITGYEYNKTMTLLFEIMLPFEAVIKKT